MFIGHFSVGFASKKFAPRTNMAVLIAAPLLRNQHELHRSAMPD